MLHSLSLLCSFAIVWCLAGVCLSRSYVQDYDEKNPATYKGLNLHAMTMAQLYQHFGLDAQTVDFIGHALALHRDDSYIDQPALPTALKIKLYHDSLTRYDGLTSPYIYPRYGLGELPQVGSVWGGGKARQGLLHGLSLLLGGDASRSAASHAAPAVRTMGHQLWAG